MIQDLASKCGRYVITMDDGQITVRTTQEARALIGELQDSARRDKQRMQLWYAGEHFERRAASIEHALDEADRITRATALLEEPCSSI